MSNIYCVKCGIEGFTKCPYCRSIFLDEEDPRGRVEWMVSHHLVIHEDRLEWKLYGKDPASGLKILARVLQGATEEELKVAACLHEWDFKPCCGSTISCGHRSEEKPLKEFLMDAASYVAEKGDERAFEILSSLIR